MTPDQDPDVSELDTLENTLGDIKNVDDETQTEATAPTIYNISSYGADFSAEQHVKRLETAAYVIPKFQRSYVWTPKKASRFIESLLLGLPVPSVFLYKEDGAGKYLVVDGQQRLRTLQFFWNQFINEKRFRLTDVHERWLGRTFEELEPADKQNLEDAIIHTIIFKQDQPSEDKSSVYHVFERLNTGGMNLTAQEIRTCVSHGVFAEKLDELNQHPSWRVIYGKVSPRMKDQELILRFLALFYEWETYERPMVEFLNSFMARYANAGGPRLQEFETVFVDTVNLAHAALGGRAFRPANAINAAVFDAAMVGLGKRVAVGEGVNPEAVRTAYDQLVNDADFQPLYQRATADKDSVMGRIRRSIAAFAEC